MKELLHQIKMGAIILLIQVALILLIVFAFKQIIKTPRLIPAAEATIKAESKLRIIKL